MPYVLDKKRPLSWSAISSFEYNPEQWFRTYILGEKQTSKEMDFGNVIDKRIQNDRTFLPKLPRYKFMQYKMNAVFSGIPLVGLPDGLDLDAKLLADYKTGKKPWDKERADEHGQLTMYLMLVYIMHKIPQEEFECRIHWLPTREEGDFSIQLVSDTEFQTFVTHRTMTDILQFGTRIKNVYKAMEKYAAEHV